MSVTQPSGGYGGPPPSRYPYPGDRDSQSRPIPPRLPSMSSLLNHEPFNEVPPMKNPFTARQHQAPYNTQPPPPVGPPHPSYTSHMDPNVAAHQTYHTLQPSTGPQQLQTPPQSMFMSLPSAHTSSLTSEPRREIKPIRVRRADQKAQDPNQGFIYNGVSYRSSDLSPTQYSSDQESQYSRRGSTFSEHSSRGQSTPQGQTMQISGLLADEPR